MYISWYNTHRYFNLTKNIENITSFSDGQIWSILKFFYRYNENYKPTKEEKDARLNLNGEITKTKIKKFEDYDEAMNFRDNYKEEDNDKGRDKK